MSLLRETWSYIPVKGYNSRHGFDPALPCTNHLIGIELEIEEWSEDHINEFGGFTFDRDGSLRGNNVEAISHPVAIGHMPALLNAFFKKFGVRNSNYSERCSTHVHFNVQNLSWDQLSVICLVYQTVERVLFGYIGHSRDEGVFCVPWSQSNLSFNLVNKMESNTGHQAIRSWMKYTALNLLPICDKGTIEFRHLYGTCDVKTIMDWICIIAKMFEYAFRVSLQDAKDQIINMNTVSNYRAWLYEVFGKYADLIQSPNSEALLAQGVIDSKLMLTQATAPPRFIYTPQLWRPAIAASVIQVPARDLDDVILHGFDMDDDHDVPPPPAIPQTGHARINREAAAYAEQLATLRTLYGSTRAEPGVQPDTILRTPRGAR